MKLENIGQCSQVWTRYTYKILMWMAFSGKNHLMVSFRLTRNVIAFLINYQVSFSTSYDLKTAKLLRTNLQESYKCGFLELETETIAHPFFF